MEINKFIEECHNLAKEKGWWDDGDRNPLEIMALIHSEISEAVEEFRKEKPPIYFKNKCEDSKPEGALIEIADAIIRIFDYCGKMGWDLEHALRTKMEYNKTRPYKHGNKKY